MKKSLYLLIVLLLATPIVSSCSGSVSNSTTEESTISTSEPSDVEVIYSHNKQRCATCVAIEKETKKLFEDELSELVRSGKVSLRVVDFSTPEGKLIATKYKVTFSSLFVVKNPGQNEKAEDLTRFAFANAKSNPEAFRKELKSKVMNAIE